jgi:tetratricopeptide (TPR) repeat protein
MEHERTVPGQGNTDHTDSCLPLIFDGFDFSRGEEELCETVLAWSEYIERLEREKPQDERTRQLLIAARRKRGMAWGILGETELAIQEFQWVLSVATAAQERREARLLLGNISAEAGQDELAIEQWSAVLAELEQASTREAKRLPIDLPRFYLYRGMLHARQEQYEQAVADCDRALRHFPGWAEAHSVKGLALAYLGDLDAGLTHCARAVELEPGARIVHRRGVVYRMRQQEVEALADFWRAWELDPTDEQLRLDLWRMLLSGAVSLLSSLPLPESNPIPSIPPESASPDGKRDDEQASSQGEADQAMAGAAEKKEEA